MEYPTVRINDLYAVLRCLEATADSLARRPAVFVEDWNRHYLEIAFVDETAVTAKTAVPLQNSTLDGRDNPCQWFSLEFDSLLRLTATLYESAAHGSEVTIRPPDRSGAYGTPPEEGNAELKHDGWHVGPVSAYEMPAHELGAYTAMPDPDGEELASLERPATATKPMRRFAGAAQSGQTFVTVGPDYLDLHVHAPNPDGAARSRIELAGDEDPPAPEGRYMVPAEMLAALYEALWANPETRDVRLGLDAQSNTAILKQCGGRGEFAARFDFRPAGGSEDQSNGLYRRAFEEDRRWDVEFEYPVHVADLARDLTDFWASNALRSASDACRLTGDGNGVRLHDPSSEAEFSVALLDAEPSHYFAFDVQLRALLLALGAFQGSNGEMRIDLGAGLAVVRRESYFAPDDRDSGFAAALDLTSVEE